MKKLMLILCVILMTGCSRNVTDTNETTPPVQTGKFGEDIPITRGQAAKMLALYKNTLAQIETLPRTITLTDTSPDMWYDKYINSAAASGLINGTQENTFDPQQYLSLEQASFILSRASDTLRLSYAADDRKKPVSYSMWVEAFNKLAGTNSGIVEEKLVITADGKDCPDLGDRFVMTTKGLKSAEGVDISGLKFCEMTVLSKDNEILAVKEVISQTPVLTLAVKDVTDNSVTVNTCGCNFTLTGNTQSLKPNTKADIKISGRNILNIEKIY